MSLANKQRLVAALLLCLALWPIAHRTLVVRARLDPWRFFGWAMYCTPKMPVMVQLIAQQGAARIPLATESLSRPLRDAVNRLSRKRALWGTLQNPDRVGARLLAEQPDADAVEIVLRHWYLDAASATIKEQRYKYRYDRTGSVSTPQPHG